MSKKISAVALAIVTFITFSCSKGDIDLASGVYSLSVISPDGLNHSGNAYLNQIGSTLTIQLFSTAGNFNYAGELNSTGTTATNSFNATGTDDSVIDLEFSPSRSSFTGSIISTIILDPSSTTEITEITGVYLVNGTKL